MAQPMQQKKVKIVSLDSKEMSGANGPWTKYVIKAHDGQYYSANDPLWFSKRKIGEVLIINFWSTVPAANKYGKMVSYNNIVTDNQGGQANQGAGQVAAKPAGVGMSAVETRIYAALATMEKNIIEAIRTHLGTDLKTIDENDDLDLGPSNVKKEETLDDLNAPADENLDTPEENLDNPF